MSAATQPGVAPVRVWLLTALAALVAGTATLRALASGQEGWVVLAGALVTWGAAWLLVDLLSRWTPQRASVRRAVDMLVPIVFGATLLFLWEVACLAFRVPTVLLPTPSAIAMRFVGTLPTLAVDFRQTVLKAVIPGWLIGCAAGFLVALLCDRVDVLRRGLLPVGTFVSALPLVGIAPIMVMWFGFDWESKAAVVVVMTFFPMLVNTLAGLEAAGHLERDLMRSYGASHGRTLLALRLPAAMPFIFNGLKINATLALIGAIVAEFFGTPIVGMGFRISTEIGRMALDMVWAEIALAAITGSLFYGLLVLVERAVTFWHPSVRMA